jgi:hypothetical protein
MIHFNPKDHTILWSRYPEVKTIKIYNDLTQKTTPSSDPDIQKSKQ